ncbi:MAG: hypothetical protein HYU87_07730 [Chloroflexi bacterium]|nr:hypothetical protein [Chloroflexota bacterium]
MRAMRWTFASRRAWAVAAGLLLAYGLLYLLMAKALVIDPDAHFSRFGGLPQLVLAPLSARSLTSWLDPAFVLYLSDAVVLAPSVPAIVTVLLLGALVGVNGAMAVEAFVRRPPACATGGGPWWVAAVVPSFLASFSCCAPTILLLVGGGAAGAVVSVIPFVVPAAALLLLGSLVWSAHRLERTTVLAVT